MSLKSGQGQLDLLPPTFAEIGQMIRYPAHDAALRWGKDPDEPGQTLDDLLQEAAWRNPRALPLLQFTLNQLFRQREGRLLTCAAYRTLGGLEGALANHAEATFTALRHRTFRPRCRRSCARSSASARKSTIPSSRDGSHSCRSVKIPSAGSCSTS